jgi:hypothetical protein
VFESWVGWKSSELFGEQLGNNFSRIKVDFARKAALSFAKIQNVFEMNSMQKCSVTLLRGPDSGPCGVLATTGPNCDSMGKRRSTISSWLRLVQDGGNGARLGRSSIHHIYILVYKPTYILRTRAGQGLGKISLEKTARSVQVLENNRGNVGILCDRAVTVRDSNNDGAAF